MDQVRSDEEQDDRQVDQTGDKEFVFHGLDGLCSKTNLE